MVREGEGRSEGGHIIVGKGRGVTSLIASLSVFWPASTGTTLAPKVVERVEGGGVGRRWWKVLEGVLVGYVDRVC